MHLGPHLIVGTALLAASAVVIPMTIAHIDRLALREVESRSCLDGAHAFPPCPTPMRVEAGGDLTSPEVAARHPPEDRGP